MGINTIGADMSSMGSLGQLTLNTLVAVGATSVIILEPNRRVAYSIYNSSTAGQEITVNIGYSLAVANKGIVLKAGQTFVDSNAAGYECYQGSITAISSAAAGQVSVFAR